MPGFGELPVAFGHTTSKRLAVQEEQPKRTVPIARRWTGAYVLLRTARRAGVLWTRHPRIDSELITFPMALCGGATLAAAFL